VANLVGQTLLGRYRIEEAIGRGGMAEVYKAWDTRRQYHIAVKVMREDLAEDLEFLRRFKREAQALAHLAHANVVRFYSFEREGRLAFIVMDYVEGTTLRGCILDAEGAPLPPDEVASIVQQVCAALHYAHTENVLHRDVKPGNIMIQPDGRVLLSDFGIAKAADAATMTTVMPGTPAYMSPEQCRSEPLDVRTDVYSLGVVAYEMLTGRRPFVGDQAPETVTGGTRERTRWEQMHTAPLPLRQFNPALPREVEEVVLKALAKEREERWPTSLTFWRALEGSLEVEAHEEAVGLEIARPEARKAGAEATTPPPSASLLELAHAEGQQAESEVAALLPADLPRQARQRVASLILRSRTFWGMLALILGLGVTLGLGLGAGYLGAVGMRGYTANLEIVAIACSSAVWLGGIIPTFVITHKIWRPKPGWLWGITLLLLGLLSTFLFGILVGAVLFVVLEQIDLVPQVIAEEVALVAILALIGIVWFVGFILAFIVATKVRRGWLVPPVKSNLQRVWSAAVLLLGPVVSLIVSFLVGFGTFLVSTRFLDLSWVTGLDVGMEMGGFTYLGVLLLLFILASKEPERNWFLVTVVYIIGMLIAWVISLAVYYGSVLVASVAPSEVMGIPSKTISFLVSATCIGAVWMGSLTLTVIITLKIPWGRSKECMPSVSLT